MWSKIGIATLLFCEVVLFGAEPKYVETSYGKVAYTSLDSGTNIVVFQAGLGDDKSTWETLLKKSNNAFSFVALDRVGKGESATVITQKRTPCDIAKEQREALLNAGFKPPFVLVGHSLGGLYQYVYAKMYPFEVLAMVLLDPTHPKHWENLQKESTALATLIETIRFVSFDSEDKKEFDMQSMCLDEIDMNIPLDIPTIFLFSGNFETIEKSTYETMLLRLRADWTKRIAGAKSKTIYSSKHYLHNEATEDVLIAIMESIGQKPLLKANDDTIASKIMIGKSNKQTIEAMMGEPSSTHKHDSETEVWVYNTKIETPLLVSFIPIVGDIADIVEMVSNTTQPIHYTIIYFDQNGVVKNVEERDKK